MKFKTSKKAIKDNYNTIIKVGYCNLQHLLNHIEPIAYSTRAEGWACDYYKVNNVIISTGYSPIGEPVNYDLLRKYDIQAESITWAEKEKVEILLKQFIAEVIGGLKK